MAKLLKLRRGTDTQHSSFTGAEGEVTVNTTNDSLHVHDGTTAGGHELAKADLSNAAGASIPGTLTTNRLVVDDDGASSPNAVFKTDDAGPWAVAIKNDTYSTTETHGLLIHQESAGDVYIRNGGNAAYENTWFQHHDGTNTRNMVRLDADGSVDLYYQNAKKLETTSTGIDVTGSVTCDGLTGYAASGDFTANFQSNNANAILEIGGASGGYIDIKAPFSDNYDLRIYSTGTGGNIYTNGGNVAFNTNVVPSADDSYDLGSSTSQWRNAYFDGTVNCDGLSCNGSATIESTAGVLVLKDTDNANSTNHQTYISGQDSGNTERWYVGNTSNSNAHVDLVNKGGAGIRFGTSNTIRCEVNASGHFLPFNNNAYDLGGASFRWRNVYTNDLNLSNEGSTNDVDGTWGSWTIQEGEDDLFLLNRRNGKKYKFNLSEVN